MRDGDSNASSHLNNINFTFVLFHYNVWLKFNVKRISFRFLFFGNTNHDWNRKQTTKNREIRFFFLVEIYRWHSFTGAIFTTFWYENIVLLNSNVRHVYHQNPRSFLFYANSNGHPTVFFLFLYLRSLFIIDRRWIHSKLKSVSYFIRSIQMDIIFCCCFCFVAPSMDHHKKKFNFSKTHPGWCLSAETRTPFTFLMGYFIAFAFTF